MKKIVALVITAVLIVSTFAACSGGSKQPNPSEIVSKMKSEITFPEMAEVSKSNLNAYYDVKNSDISDCSYIIAGSGMTADEVLIIKANNADSAKNIVSLMKSRRDQIRNTAADYTPAELEKLTTAVIGQNGVYAYYAVTNNNTKAKEIIDAAF